MRSTEVFKLGIEEGHSKLTLRRAKLIADVEVNKRGEFGKSAWHWRLKDRRCSMNTEDTQPNNVGTFDKVEYLRENEALPSEGGEG